MSDGQTHGARLEIKTGCRVSIGRSEVAHYPGETWSLEITDKWGDEVATPDRTTMLREAYALAKSANDYNAMAQIASQL